jgi:hypothetical protein
MKLPNGDRTKPEQIANKLETYALNFEHTSGRHKARLFRSWLGIVLENKHILENTLKEQASLGESIDLESSDNGAKYVIEFSLTTEVGTAIIRSASIVRTGEDYPRLTSVYPIDKRK